MTVVFLHFKNLMIPDESLGTLSSWQHFLLALASPLTTGGEAVILFFVLSGFVLMLPYTRGKNQPYGIFVVRRILRIYGPYIFALAFAVAGAALWHGDHGLDRWGMKTWSQPVSWRLVLQHVLMLGVYNYHEYNPVFWTLIEEMRISLIYPVLAYLVLRLPARYTLLLAAALALSARGIMRLWPSMDWIMTLEYTGMFLCGMVLANNFAAISQWYRRRNTAARGFLALFAFVVYVTGHLARHGSEWLMTFASMAFILVALASRRAGALLTRGPINFLGRISYSLYLIHIPVLMALTITLHPYIPAWVILPLYVCISVGIASVFHRVVEMPFTTLSRRVVRRVKAPAEVLVA